MKRCERCKFYDGVSRHQQGENLCRKSAPVGGRFLWPRVRPEDWCGSFEAAEDSELSRRSEALAVLQAPPPEPEPEEVTQ